jgi:organic hydroperoxide reductase OsmC/OhrA
VHIAALVKNARGSHGVEVATGDSRKSLAVPCRDAGLGSSINGGEFLMLALATCYCNDLYREAARLGIAIDSVEVSASGDFEGVGLAARNITYQARVVSAASGADVTRLLRETDAVAEIHNTLRSGVPVKLQPWGTDSAV